MIFNEQTIKLYLKLLGYDDQNDDLIFFDNDKIELRNLSKTNFYNTQKIDIIINILKLLGIDFESNNVFLPTDSNLKKLPTKKELFMILENFSNYPSEDFDNKTNLNCLQYCTTKVNSIILKPSLSTLDPQGSQIKSPYFFENIWYKTKRGNSLRFAKGFKSKFQKYLKKNTEQDFKKNTEQDFKKIKEKNEDFFIAFFSKALLKMNEKNPNFLWQDAINTLIIAKAFGGLSNLKHHETEGYRKITDDKFIKEIKEKFLNDPRFNSLDDVKLKQYKTFSKLYQKTTQDILKSNRGKNNQTGLRLTFFPDLAIERLLEIKKEDFDLKNSAKIIEDFAKQKPKSQIYSI